LRYTFRIPSLLTIATRSRRRDKGYAALSRGMVAVGAGDAQLARKSALEAQKYLRHEPLTLLLRAQAAQLSDASDEASRAFEEMTRRSDTRLLGLRGLHFEAQRRGEAEKARQFAKLAHEIAPLPWSARAGVEHQAAAGDWRSALAALESGAGARHVDKQTRERQRAVLETALALDKAETEPEEALALVRAAIKRQPGLVPAIALAAKLLSRKGDIRKAAKLIEAAWPLAPHPDLAKIYLNSRPGESHADRLARAQALARLAPSDAESKIAVAQAAIAAGDFKTSRESLQPLIESGTRPTTRVCLLMADLEEAEHGAGGYVREWLARASRAPQDPAWVADGVVSEHWLPASPVTGKLDAFVWRRPVERLKAGVEAEEAVFTPISASAPSAKIEDAPAKALSPPTSEAAAAGPSAITADASGRPAGNEPTTASEGVAGDQVIFPLPAAPDDPGQEEKRKPRGFAQFF
jgi:HemY protein